MISAYFGALRHTETEGLLIENFVGTKDGIIVTHSRAKVTLFVFLFSWSMKETRFLIPRQEGSGPNYCKIVESYLEIVKLEIGKQSGRVWYTGRHTAPVPIPMGKNTVSKVSVSCLKFSNI